MSHASESPMRVTADGLGGPLSGWGAAAGWRMSGGAATALAAAALMAGTTFLHGRMTDRWVVRDVSAELKQAAEMLESRFPKECGSWEIEEELPFDPQELKRAGAVGHVSRVYHNRKNKGRVTAFVVCANARDASGHTPDRCYPGAGFEIAETEHRETIPLADGGSAEAYTGTFRKQGKTLRVYWTYGVEGRWLAPQLARIELAGAKAVFKVYAIIEETSLPPGVGSRMCVDLLTKILPEFNAAAGWSTGPSQDGA